LVAGKVFLHSFL